MGSWQLQHAKTRLSELIEDANTKGPQIITRHGTDRAVVVSIAEYGRLSQGKEKDRPSLVDVLLSGPKLDDDDPFWEALERHADPERDYGL